MNNNNNNNNNNNIINKIKSIIKPPKNIQAPNLQQINKTLMPTQKKKDSAYTLRKLLETENQDLMNRISIIEEDNEPLTQPIPNNPTNPITPTNQPPPSQSPPKKSQHKKSKSKKLETPGNSKQAILEKRINQQLTQKYAANIKIVRKEIFTNAPLSTLSLLNQIKISFQEYNRRTGKTEKRLNERLRKEEMDRLNSQYLILSKIKKECAQIINDYSKPQFTISLSIDREHIQDLEAVLSDPYFSIFESIQEIKPNPNYLCYNINLPIVLTFTRAKANLI